MLENIKDYIDRHSRLLLWLAIFIYIIFFSIACLIKYYNFHYNVYDLAIFNQVFFNTLQGCWFEMTINLNNYLGDHFAPIIILLLPFYWLKQSPESLLVLQSVILGLSAWPLYRISRAAKNNKTISLSVALLWLFNSFVHSVNSNEFHLLPLAAFFIFWTFYFYYKSNFKFFLLFFILSLLVKEDVGFVLLGFSALAFLDKRSLKWKLSSLILPLAYLFMAMKIISHFSILDNYKFLIYYSWLGGADLGSMLLNALKDPLKVFLHLFSFNNIVNLFFIVSPVLFLPFLKPKYLLLALLPFLEFAMVRGGFPLIVYKSQYILLLLPGIFIATIFALRKIYQKKKFIGSQAIYEYKGFFISTLLFVSVTYFLIVSSTVIGFLAKDYNEELRINRQNFVNTIPPQASLVAEATFLPHLSNRQIIYPLGYTYYGKGQFALDDFVLPPVDFILVDSSGFMNILVDLDSNAMFAHVREQSPTNWRSVLMDYSLIKANNSVLLWQNKGKIEAEDVLDIYHINDNAGDVNNLDFLVESELELKDNQKILKLTFQKNHPEANNYLIRFYQKNGYFDMPLDYGLLPEVQWPEQSLVTFYYYLDDNVESYQVFSWQGINILSRIMSFSVDLELKEESLLREL
ncbi:DUF2079 domain-containing protein [bacterium]|nr:DUF2079 domain-containing protein [bacterium]